MSHTESQVERSGHQTSGRRKPAEPQQTFRQVEPYATCPELADRLMHCLIADGIDVASCFQSDPTAGIEGPFTFAYDMFLPDRSTPVVPFLLSRYLPHQATSARCYTVGQSIRRAIESWDSDMRVAIMASGGPRGSCCVATGIPSRSPANSPTSNRPGSYACWARTSCSSATSQAAWDSLQTTARTAAHRLSTGVSRSAASPAPTMAGCTTRRVTSSRPRQSGTRPLSSTR